MQKDQPLPFNTPLAPSGPERIYWAQGPPELRGQAGRTSSTRVPGSVALAPVAPFPMSSGGESQSDGRRRHGYYLVASVFRLFTHQTRHLVSSFNMENNQRIKARLLRWFPANLKKYMIFGLVFCASVFRLFTHRTRYLV